MYVYVCICIIERKQRTNEENKQKNHASIFVILLLHQVSYLVVNDFEYQVVS